MRINLAIALLVVSSTSTASTQTFSEFLEVLSRSRSPVQKTVQIERYVANHSFPMAEGDSVHFVYRGKGNTLAVPGDINGWNPDSARMSEVATGFYHFSLPLPSDARIEYKIWVDSAWILDPLNPHRAPGGYGENSEFRMPAYTNGSILDTGDAIPRGSLDTLVVPGSTLGASHPVIIYLPAGVSRSSIPLPALYVTDGGEYLTLGGLAIALDRLIASGNIRPLVAVCVDPRTDLHNPSTNRRMMEYSAKSAFLDYLASDVIPTVEHRYPISPERRVILGASLGGLIATYSLLTRPDLFPACAAQSPAYRQSDGAVITRVTSAEHVDGDIVIQTGTIHDTEPEAYQVSELLKSRGARVDYSSSHEGHNWTNWRSHLPSILRHFFPR